MTSKSTSYPLIGLLEWFRPGEYERVEKVIADLRALGISQLRTGLSWADYYTPGAAEWYNWLFPVLAKEVDVLPCVLYTPPSIGIAPKTSAPPKNHKDYADFLDLMITNYGNYFEWVELWNEPNNKVEYDFTLDPSWDQFAKMISGAGYWARQRGKKTVLGGMSPIDPNWLNMMFYKGVMEHIDALGIHGFPDVFDQQWDGWDNNVRRVREVLNKNNAQCELWITEVGFSTWQHDEHKQVREFQNVLKADVDRVYWYSAYDLDPLNATVGGFHLDDREYHFGLKHTDGSPKLLYNLLEKNGIKNIDKLSHLQSTAHSSTEKGYSLVTGGAGFIGTNVAKALLDTGKRVMIYDNLSAKGSEANLKWLHENYGTQVVVKVADIRDIHSIKAAIEDADEVYHFCSAENIVAKSTYAEFDINIRGSVILLEALKNLEKPIPLVVLSSERISENGNIHGAGRLKTNSFTNFDQYFLQYKQSDNLPILIIKSNEAYGCFDYKDIPGTLNLFISLGANKQLLKTNGSSQQTREYIFAEDLGKAAVATAKEIANLPEAVYHIRSNNDHALNLLELLDKLKQLIKLDFHIKFNSTSGKKKRAG